MIPPRLRCWKKREFNLLGAAWNWGLVLDPSYDGWGIASDHLGWQLVSTKNTACLQNFTSPPFQIYQGTFLDVTLPHSFDLIHGRYVLIHNQSDLDILRKMFSLLKPGGWALFEEPDFTSAQLQDHGLENAQSRVNGAICQMFHNAGLDPAYALRLPQKLEQTGFHIARAQSIMHLCPGKSPMATVMGESALVLEQQYCGTGLCSPEDIQQYVSLSQDPTHWAVYHSTTSVIVRKP
jgi:hypothetical protein